MSEKASTPTLAPRPPSSSTRQPFIPKADKWTTKVWHTYLKLRPVFSESHRDRVLSTMSDAVLIAVYVMNTNPAFKDQPMIRKYIDYVLEWESTGAESAGGTLITMEQGTLEPKELKELQDSALEDARRVMEDEHGGARSMRNFLWIVFCLSEKDVYVIAETDNILQELWREIDQDIEKTLKTHRWENLMQGQPAAYTLPHEISVDSIWMDHIQGAIVAGRLDSQVLLRGDPRGMEDARADLIDWRRHQWDLWEVDSKGLQGVEKKRAFRVWKGDAATVFREEFPPWRRARMERERSEK